MNNDSIDFDTDDQEFLSSFLWKVSERYASMLKKYSKNTGTDEMDDDLPSDEDISSEEKTVN